MKNVFHKNIEWKIYQGALIPNVAPHIEIDLTYNDKKYLLKESGAYFLRYITDWDIDEKTEFWYIIKDKKEDLQDYKSKIRNQIRKGLKNCIVEKVDNIEIAKTGYEVYRKAFKRYQTDLKPIEKNKFYNSITKSKGYDFFAVYNKEDNKIIAYSMNRIQDNMVNYSTIKFDPEYLRLYSSYALFFTMNEYYLNQKNYLYVSDGARSIAHDTNIQNYLIEKFHFRKAYCKLNIYYRKDVKLLVNLLFPFRKIISKIDNKIFNKISILLKQEEIYRKEKYARKD